VSQLDNDCTYSKARFANLKPSDLNLTSELEKRQSAISQGVGKDALRKHVVAANTKLFAQNSGPNLSLVSAETPEFVQMPSVYARRWARFDQKSVLREIPPLLGDAPFWSFP
jgi:hypothetical protein